MGFLVAALLSLATLPARADRGGFDDDGNHGDRGGEGREPRSAPEPLTLAGLALGAGALAAARRRSRKLQA